MRKNCKGVRIGAVRTSAIVLAAAIAFGVMLQIAHAGQSVPAAPTINESTVKSVLVLSLRSATQPQRCSNETLAAEIFTDSNSVNAYYAENSYGRASISGTVSGPYTIAVGNTCDRNNWASQANAAATAAGVNVSANDMTAYILPPESTALGCPAGFFGGKKIWIREDACDSKMAFAHEMGHAFRAGHSHTPASEYGDLSSVMGGIFDALVNQPTYLSQFNSTPHFNAPQKIDEGWLPAGNVQTVTVGGSYKVALLENTRPDVQALKVIAGRRIYYCSYRRAVGLDSSLLPPYVDKTSVHISNNRGVSTLYANLGDGQSYREGPFSVTQTSHDATYAYLTISFDMTTTPVAARARPPEPRIRGIATIPDVAVDEAVRLPNGRIVLYAVRDTITAYDLAAKRGTLVTRGFDGALAISPAGDRIAYAHESEDGKTDVIFAMPIDPKSGTATGPAQRVSTNAGYWPSFSPDGKLIAFRVDQTPNTWNLATVPTSGGSERTLASYDKQFGPVSWSADGKSILVAVREVTSMGRQTTGSIERIPAAGGRSESLISYPRLAEGAGQVNGHVAFYRPDVAAQAEGRLAYITASGAHGEFNIPPGSRGFAQSTQSLFTHTTEPSRSPAVPFSEIYELDVSPILRALAK
jgi:hypothetical protein